MKLRPTYFLSGSPVHGLNIFLIIFFISKFVIKMFENLEFMKLVERSTAYFRTQIELVARVYSEN